ncbi:MAG: ECF transporter S component [Clostridia bacterium]|nr:ECF transporter S component [Clostridia bacterium]MBQ9757341.1 ECF transporter S component [Clostridia bacterium]
MKTKKLVTAALFAAIVCVATLAIRIPSGLSGGYVNMGDAGVLLSAYLLGPLHGGLAGGLGSCLADIAAGYASFAIPTLVIKFWVAFVGGLLFAKGIKAKSWIAIAIYGIIAECIMIGGYFLVEIWLSGSVFAAAAGIVGNITQAVFGVVVSTAIYKFLCGKKAVMNFFK